ncbi:AAA family ATPase [Mycobacterium gastri]|uniref:AAA family ATPase n=1 Tax=Mycobacterium gastri TaxID=1777 RepID=UPI0004B88ADA|nr:AAA family ATPase [Mycobacterium gastri]
MCPIHSAITTAGTPRSVINPLLADLDVAPGKCATIEVAHAVVDDLSAILGTRPSAIVDSGHGLHPYWPVADGQIVDGDIRVARALVRRWGRLVTAVAGARKAETDNVFDLARMMRVPGTRNNKSVNGQGALPVTGYADSGAPLAMAEIDERLTEVGVIEEPGDRDNHAEEISPPSEWTWAEQTCAYVARMVEAWASDAPKPGAGRHPWLVNQMVRLNCAHRCGCIAKADYRAAYTTLAQRFGELVRGTEPRREPQRHEVAGAWDYGRTRTAAKTDEAVHAELGGHEHLPPVDVQETKIGGDSEGDPFTRVVTLVPLTEIEDRPAQWIWEHDGFGRIQRGVLTLFAGRPASGKSTAARGITTDMSNGNLNGCWKGQPQKIAYISAEECDDDVKAGYRATGADMSPKRPVVRSVRLTDGSGGR